MPVLGEELEPESGQLVLQPGADPAVASPHRVESLVEDGAERSVERLDHRDGRGVVVRALRARDVALEETDVEVPGLWRSRACAHAGPGALGEREGRQSGRDTEALLGAR